MVEDATNDNNVSGPDLLRFLTSWLSFHILSEDQNMAHQVRSIQSGQCPVSHPNDATDVRTSLNTVLVDALLDLFSLVSQRNQTLKSLNESLLQARTELELRVEERTCELKLANTALSKSLEQIHRSQEQLLQSEKMAAVGQLAAGVAHEINNPIGFVTANFSSLSSYNERLFSVIDTYEKMECELPTEHPSRQAVAKARELAEYDYLRQDIPDLLRESAEGLNRVKRIVADLSDISHVDAEEWQYADLNDCLESTLNMVASEIKCKAEVISEFGEIPPLYCLPAQLCRVFMNLLVNAAQAIETNGLITLHTGVVANEIQISISDTGRGIPEALQQRIFEPFFTTKLVGKGTGLGLSVSWDIIKRHNGQLTVTSHPNAGATFLITLPISSHATKGAEAS
jgi:signal transduction histidine kinase